MAPYGIVYGKACHLPVEVEFKAWWAIKKLNFDLDRAKLKKMFHLNELEEIHNDAYNNASITKARNKKWHDRHISRKEFHIGQKVFFMIQDYTFFLVSCS